MIYPMPYPLASCFVFSPSLKTFLCEFNSSSPRWHFSEFLSRFLWGLHSLFLRSWLVTWRNGTAFIAHIWKVGAWELPVLTKRDVSTQELSKAIILGLYSCENLGSRMKLWVQNEGSLLEESGDSCRFHRLRQIGWGQESEAEVFLFLLVCKAIATLDPAPLQLTCLGHWPNTYSFPDKGISTGLQTTTKVTEMSREIICKGLCSVSPFLARDLKSEIQLRTQGTIGLGEGEGKDPH